MIGRMVGNHYEIIEYIGRGGMAEVYKAYDHGVERVVAIKVMLRDYAEDSTLRQRFVREARSIAGLEHLHILPLYTYGQLDGRLYLVMRYMPHGSLYDLIRKGPLPLSEVGRLLTQVAAALDYAHSHQVLHRDLKPENVLLDEHRNAYLADFGLARRVTDSEEARLTGNYLVGTPQFMSPEQCRDTELTPAADQYALGIMVYNMITGTIPFDGGKPVDIMWKQISTEPQPPGELREDLTDRAEAAVLRTLAKDPVDRFPNCTAFAEAFTAGMSSGLYRMKGSSVPIGLQRHIDQALSSFDEEDDDDE